MTEPGLIAPTGGVEADVLETVAAMITDVIGEEYLLGQSIGMQTSFTDDLQLESIEFVTLAEKLQERYGEHVDFIGWISEKEMDEIIAMRVGDLVGYIASCLS